MADHDLKVRTKKFALRIIRLVGSLPRDQVGDVLGRQLMKSGTSIGSNYREATRASSKKHFISIIEISIRESDETLYWLELLAESEIMTMKRLDGLKTECTELMAMLIASAKTAKKSLNKASTETST